MNELQIDPKFDVFKLNEYNDQSIEQYDAREFYQPTGKSLDKFRGTKLRIQTKGDQLMDIANGLLEVDVNYTYDLPVDAGNASIVITEGVNDKIYTRIAAGAPPPDAAGVVREITLTPGIYANAAALDAVLKAQITASYALPANAGNNFTIDVDAGAIRIASATADFFIGLGYNLAIYLGFGAAQVGVYVPGDLATLRGGVGNTVAANTIANSIELYNTPPRLNPNSMAIFRKATLYANNIELHAIDFPDVPLFINRALNYSADYQSKRQDLHFFYDRSPTIVQFDEVGIEGDTNAAEYARRSKSILAADPAVAGVGIGNSIVYNIKLKDIFPYFKSFDKATRGITYTVELDINPEVHQVLPRLIDVIATNINFRIKNLSLWVPNLKASVVTEAALIEDMKANKDGMVLHYENPQVYRTVHAPTTNFTWVIDSVAKIPKRIYVGFQSVQQLDTCVSYDTLGTDANPTTYQHYNMRNCELRIGSDTYPRQPYVINFEESTLGTAQNYERLFSDFCSSGMAQELDNAGLVSYRNYRECYPLVCFNVEREGVLQVEDQIHDVTVNFTFKNNQPTDFYATALIVYDDSIAIRTDGLSRLKLSK